MKGFLSKRTATESRFAIAPENIPFAGMCVRFSAWKLEIVQAAAVKGLKGKRQRAFCLRSHA